MKKDQIETLGIHLLDCQPNAVVRYRLLRDVLQIPSDSKELVTARQHLLEHPWVIQLAREQGANGAWGRFHTQDTKIKTGFITCEHAIRRALALGLDRDTPVLAKAVEYMVKVLNGEAVWSDRVEKSEGRPIGVEAITAATLAQVDPDHPAVGSVREYSVRVANRCFPNGVYSPEAEWAAHKELRGIGIRFIRSAYVLILLSSRSTPLPVDLEQKIINWIWHESRGNGYLGIDLQLPSTRSVLPWLKSLEILSPYSTFRKMSTTAIDWCQPKELRGFMGFRSQDERPGLFSSFG